MEFLVLQLLHKREMKIQSLPSLCAKTSHQPFPTECACPGSWILLPCFNHSDLFRLFFSSVNWIWIKDYFPPTKQYLLWILVESHQSSVRLDSSSSPKTLSYQRSAVINSLLGNHSLRQPNTCNHRICMQEGCWDSYWPLAQHSKLQVFQWITTPHLKVFFPFEWQKQNSVKKIPKLCARDNSAQLF